MPIKLSSARIFAFAVMCISGLICQPSAEAAKKTDKVVIAAGRPDDAWFALSHGLASMINERSSWLEAEVIPTAGIVDATRLAQGDPAKRVNHIVITMTPGMELWATPEYTTKKIGSMGFLASVLVSLDPKIKTLEDLKGKTLALSRKVPQSYTYIYIDMLRQAGVLDKIKLMHGGTSAVLNAVQDGAANAGAVMISCIYPDTFAPGAFLEQLAARGPLYFPEQGLVEKNMTMIGKAGKQEVFKDAPLPTLALTAPPKSLGPNQTEPVVILTPPVFWAAGTQVPDRIIHEVTRIMYEAAEKREFGNYHVIGKGMLPDFLVSDFWPDDPTSRKNYHSGALKYFDERGIKLKTFAPAVK